PVPLLTPDGTDYKVIFGTGGETIGGSLFLTTLSQIMKGDISDAKLLDTSPTNGYIGPPVWVDLTNDGNPDIVTNAVEGKLVAFDGISSKPLWSTKMYKTEAYSSVAPGYFTGNDDVPDFFVSYAVGQWPDLGWSKQFMVNGATGKIEYVDSLGSYQTSTPVIIDLDGDGRDEAILNVNVEVYDAADIQTFQNILTIINFGSTDINQLSESYPGSNISSTPWIGDSDNDGLLDVIYCHGTNIKKTYAFTGIQTHRLATGIPIKSKIRWGAYMGNNYNGVFERR
ncbi:MAG TPA: hypothetical protein VK666_29970, partial [Chryseolinea sp.]|nr:hypothetical protein [Chryseolinea sp.]